MFRPTLSDLEFTDEACAATAELRAAAVGDLDGLRRFASAAPTAEVRVWPERTRVLGCIPTWPRTHAPKGHVCVTVVTDVTVAEAARARTLQNEALPKGDVAKRRRCSLGRAMARAWRTARAAVDELPALEWSVSRCLRRSACPDTPLDTRRYRWSPASRH